LSSETISEGLNQEIQEGGTEPYVAGHIAAIHRKNAILKYFKQERDVLSNVTDNEIRALGDALLLAQPLAKPESVCQANKMLNETDHRSTMYLSLHNASMGRTNMAVNRKRKVVGDDSGLRSWRYGAKHYRASYQAPPYESGVVELIKVGE